MGGLIIPPFLLEVRLLVKVDIQATKDAIEILRQALKRQNEYYKHGVYLEASIPVWNAANFLWRSLPKEDRE